MVMPEQIERRSSSLEATYKAREVEGFLDVHFYRKIGFQLAQLFARLKMTPAGVSLLGGCVGITAGHLYYYQDLRLNVIGMALHVFANALDNADGQLARLLNQKSRMGRVIDSVADHLIFISIYVHLALRYLTAGASPAICLVALAAGVSHALQGAAADYYRNAYLYFAKGRSRADFDSSAALRDDFRRLRWRDRAWHKVLLALYLNFTMQQEMLSPNLRRLREETEHGFPDVIPASLQMRFAEAARPEFKWWGLLMTNTRMFFLFFFLFAGRPIWFFWLELTVFNFLLVYLIFRQEKLSRSLLGFATAMPAPG